MITKNILLKHRRRRGLSLVEILVALAITALLLTATAIAFEAAMDSYTTNHDLAMVSISTRNVLHQMCSNIRSSWNDPVGPPPAPTYVTADGTECTFFDQGGREITYAYNAAQHRLEVNIDNGPDWFTLVENVYPITAGDHIFTLTDPEDTSSFPAGTAGRVEIRFRVVQNDVSRTVSAAAVPCNVLYH
ncbi:MAG: prepilin-type N-terminal cleavage/methylation domain-containing protein [Sedimentisphaerales bacterium]|nr:prepilin-type N-terminal cleavage/methylation domain-containing protein [Sedimentisphaerales bacterium]